MVHSVRFLVRESPTWERIAAILRRKRERCTSRYVTCRRLGGTAIFTPVAPCVRYQRRMEEHLWYTSYCTRGTGREG